MMYKHWEKILLAMTGFFWGACNAADNSTVTKKVVSKEVSKIDASKLKPVTKDTLNIIKDSSNLVQAVPIYGINPPPIEPITKVPCAQKAGNFIVKCLNDVICVDDNVYPGCAEKKPTVAAKYGTIATTKKRYTCDNGKTYTEAGFAKYFTIVDLPTRQ
jgi:hypothetical protein